MATFISPIQAARNWGTKYCGFNWVKSHVCLVENTMMSTLPVKTKEPESTTHSGAGMGHRRQWQKSKLQ